MERAVAVLGALAEHGDLGTNEIARRTGINPSTVSRTLTTLAQDEYVRKVPTTGRYQLGVRLVQLGNAALARLDLRELARPHLVAVVEATGETAALSVPAGTTAVTVDCVPSPSSVRSVAELGRPSVPHATSTGKVYLAYTGKQPVAPLEAFTPHTITDLDELMRQVAEVREQGWALSVGEREPDLHSVAVPVLDRRGGLVALLSVQGPATRLHEAAMRQAAELLRSRADQLSASL